MDIGDDMDTNTLLYILIGLVIILILVMLFLLVYLRKQPKDYMMLGALKEQLDDQDENDKTLLLKSQETATTLLGLSQQFQTLMSELHILSKGSFKNGETMNEMALHLNEMQKVMVNKKARGNFGEYQLDWLLESYVGQSTAIYEKQYPLSSGVIGDVAFHLPNQEEVLILDAKFPMENYLQILNYEGQRAFEEKYRQLLKSNIKKHIHDISKKYITDQTLDVAIMFIPSEAVYAYVLGEFPELIDEAFKYHVMMTSPTTLSGVLFSLLHSYKQFYRSQNIKEIEKELALLSDDLKRLSTRAENAKKYAIQTTQQMEDLEISLRKVSNHIHKITNGEEKI